MPPCNKDPCESWPLACTGRIHITHMYWPTLSPLPAFTWGLCCRGATCTAAMRAVQACTVAMCAVQACTAAMRAVQACSAYLTLCQAWVCGFVPCMGLRSAGMCHAWVFTEPGGDQHLGASWRALPHPCPCGTCWGAGTWPCSLAHLQVSSSLDPGILGEVLIGQSVLMWG